MNPRSPTSLCGFDPSAAVDFAPCAADGETTRPHVPLPSTRPSDGNSPERDLRETQTWHAAYQSEAQRRRRRRTFPRKLRWLGIDRADQQARVLDLCCGHGEALEELYALGFRQLVGLDITLHQALAADARFEVYQADARRSGLPGASFDWILNIHSLHHLGMAADIALLLDECWRLLKPGGRLGIIDFPNSPQIRFAFWWFRQEWFQWTPYLKNFGRMIREEWCFLKDYLPQFPEVWQRLLYGRFRVESLRRGLFYFYLTLRKGLDEV